jgi:hypothetical protein
MVKGWRKDATNEYAIAYKLNPDVTVDPRMLKNLVDCVVHGSTAAQELLKTAYGKQAIPMLDDALRNTGPNRVLAERLRKVRDELSR